MAGGESLTAFLAARRSSLPTVVYGDMVLSFADLDDQARRVARGLADLGVGPGDRVGLWLPNAPAWLVLYFACARLGAVAVAVNTRYRSAEVEDIVGRSGCKVLVLWPGFKGIDFSAILADVPADALGRLETVVTYGEGDEPKHPPLPGRRQVSYAELAACPSHRADPATGDAPSNIFTTSGTTRAPKLVLHKQSVMVDHGQAVARAFAYDAPDARLLHALPFCGVFGLCQAMAILAAGRPMVLMPAFEVEAAVRLMREHRITHTNLSDEMIDRMLDAVPDERPFPDLRDVGYASFNAALGDIVARAEARGVVLLGLYGMSEVQALFSRQPPAADTERRARGGGIPVSAAVSIRVRDPETGHVQPDGEAGEIEIQGPSTMVGYDQDAAATADAFTGDGFLKTGDLGYTTGDGGFVFLARMGDALRLGGWLVNPGEIEAFLQGHPAVDGCQVVGLSRAGRSRAVAFVTAVGGHPIDEADVRDFCRRGLADYKVPERIFTVDDFPVTRSANGTKIQRAELRRMAEAWMEKDAATG